MSRARLVTEFLANHGYSEAKAVPLAPDASFRRYLRLIGGPRPAVLMDSPPPEDFRPFVRIAGHLAAIGLSAPEIYAADEAEGLLLEEDLGDDLVSSLMGTSCSPTALFECAIDALLAMQRAVPPSDLPAWDARTMAATALATLLDWWWPAMFGTDAPGPVRQEFAAALEAMLAAVAAGPVCFVHRDYFADNLLWLPQRSGIRRIGVLDFQNAAIGHPAYDLASLLQDERRDISATLAEHAIAYYLSARLDLDPSTFRAAYAACAALRHLRIAGQWVRLARRDGRRSYLAHGPRTWHLLQRAVREPVAAPLAAVLDRWVPADRRRNPPELAA
jgi:N-acetylmuramate 1-kinase